MKLSWKLLPVATLFALGIFMVSLPSGTKQANAGANGISVVPIIANSQYQLTTSFSNNPAGIGAVLAANGFGVFTSATVTGSTSVAAGFIPGQSTTVTFSGDTSGSTATTTSITALFTCTSSGTTTFTLTQSAGSPQATTSSVPVTCNAGGVGGGIPGSGQLSIQSYSTVLAQGAQGSYTAYANTTINGQYITVTGNPAIITLQQPNISLNGLTGTQDTVYGQNTASVTDIASQPGNRTITGTFICVQQGTVTLSISLGATPGVVGVGIGTDVAYSQPIVCGTGLVSPTVGPASSVTVAASPTSVGCNGTAFVTVTVRNALGGYVADGTSVSLTSSVGSLSPNTATTLGGGVLAVFTAGNQSGTANIQASAAGTAQGTASITVNCNAAQPTPVPVISVPPTIAIPSNVIIGGGGAPIGGGATGIIVPPNTGDAGLASNDGWHVYAGIALVVMSGVGAAFAVRKHA